MMLITVRYMLDYLSAEGGKTNEQMAVMLKVSARSIENWRSGHIVPQASNRNAIWILYRRTRRKIESRRDGHE